MRSMEEDFREEFSEDEHPSTDASEDSVEVHVTPIVRPHHTHPTDLSRLPRKFRKAFEKSDHPERISSVEFINTVKKEETLSKGRLTPTSPVDFSVTSLTTGRASPLRPHSPPSTSRVRGNRRKPADPRKVVESETSLKRPNEEEWKPRKVPRVEERLGNPHPPETLLPPYNILGHNPFIGHLVPPHLLLPPAWHPVVRYPYTHLVGGVLAPPLGLLPTAHYPLLPILPPRLPVTPAHSPKPLLISGDNSIPQDEKPPKVFDPSGRINGLLQTSSSALPPPPPSDTLIVPSSSLSLDSSSVIRKSLSKSSCKQFFSVESLLSNKPKKEFKDIDEEEEEEDYEDELGDQSPDQGTIQSLLQHQPKQKQRNYKNMTRERRIEANARERTRVHTISAAFETLRQSVPSFSHNQKLSKLSVLRIASSYILSLSRLAGHDYSDGSSTPSFAECVDITTKTIQVEGKAKKKRDE